MNWADLRIYLETAQLQGDFLKDIFKVSTYHWMSEAAWLRQNLSELWLQLGDLQLEMREEHGEG